jgi:hypothetical protein
MTISSGGFCRHVTRRELLIGTAAAAPRGRGATLAFAAAVQPATPVSFKVLRGACDCHTHVFCDPQRFAFWSGHTYTPETATVKEMRALHGALHVERIVFVIRWCTALIIPAWSMRSANSAIVPEALRSSTIRHRTHNSMPWLTQVCAGSVELRRARCSRSGNRPAAVPGCGQAARQAALAYPNLLKPRGRRNASG